MDQRKVAQRIRTLRKEIGLSQDELAARSGISRRIVQKIEKGNHNATLETLRALEVTLGAPLLTSDITPAPQDPLPDWAANISDRLRALESPLGPSSRSPSSLSAEPPIPPELWAAWNGCKEKWRQSVAMFFLTADPAHLENDVPNDKRKLILDGLRFFGKHPKVRAPKR